MKIRSRIMSSGRLSGPTKIDIISTSCSREIIKELCILKGDSKILVLGTQKLLICRFPNIRFFSFQNDRFCPQMWWLFEVFQPLKKPRNAVSKRGKEKSQNREPILPSVFGPRQPPTADKNFPRKIRLRRQAQKVMFFRLSCRQMC